MKTLISSILCFFLLSCVSFAKDRNYVVQASFVVKVGTYDRQTALYTVVNGEFNPLSLAFIIEDVELQDIGTWNVYVTAYIEVPAQTRKDALSYPFAFNSFYFEDWDYVLLNTKIVRLEDIWH